MLENIDQVSNLNGLARRKARLFDIKAVHPADKDKYVADGWEFVKQLKLSIQIKRKKLHGASLEDRVWTLFHRMHVEMLSTDGGAKLVLNPKNTPSLKSQIDVVVIDREIAIAIECKSSFDYRKRPQFQEELGKFCQIKEPFVKAIKGLGGIGSKRHCVFVMALNRVLLSEQDRERAKKSGVILIDERDLVYYESLVAHLGAAAKYQILADWLPGKEISGLSIRIPAIKIKMGGYNCYSFSIAPQYLLKIAYVSHRAKGKASDIHTYQRMLAKGRLKKIQQYILDEGVFPTNVILNFERNRLGFQKIKQEADGVEDLDTGVLGWLDIKPAFKSAWVIDGQHRLFAFSGLEDTSRDKLIVLAFEGLKPSKQAELFIDINAKQKSVKQSLLQELYAELHWDSSDPAIRISAIISKAIQDLNSDPESCMYQRIQTTDGIKDSQKCITLTSLFSQIEKKGFFIIREKGASVLEYGPLWGGDDNILTLKRTVAVLKNWLNIVAKINTEWWNIGSGEGGGLAMNDGVAALIAVLRSVFEVLERKGYKLIAKSDRELVHLISPYAEALGKYLGTLDLSERKRFRDARGVIGVSFRTRQCQYGMTRFISDFSPEGLDHWVNEQRLQTNKHAKDIIDRIEVKLQQFIISELQAEYTSDEQIWWYEGVPSAIRAKATSRMEEDKNKRGGREYYFDLIDYKKIIVDNWQIFEKYMAFGKGSKDKRVEWLDFVNETRKIVAHASSGKTVKIEDFNRLVEFNSWLENQLVPASE